MAKKRLPHPDPVEEARRERIRARKRAQAKAARIPTAALPPEEQAQRRAAARASARGRYIPISDLSPEEQAQRRAKNNAYLSTWRPQNRGRIKGYHLNRIAREGELFLHRERQRSQEYVATHRETHAAAGRRWAQNNPDKVAAKSARWYAKAVAADEEAFRAQRREKGRIQRAKHGPKYVERHKKWAHDHPEIITAASQRRRARKANAPLNDFTAKQWRALCKAAGYLCAYCHKKFPFKELTRDHIIPLSKGGSHTLSNIIPACMLCNQRKHVGDVPTPVQPFLLLPEEDAAAD